MRAVPGLPYRDFYYPLNVFMHILTLEEGDVRYLHYGLFEHENEPLIEAQERSTSLLLSRLPKPPARLLDAGCGIGTTLDRLTREGYDVTGITPDAQQVAYIRERYGDSVRVEPSRFEDFTGSFDVILFQESSQYIDAEALFAHAKELAPRVLVLDEFALRDAGGLHTREAFVAASQRHGFTIAEELNLDEKAAPTSDYFNVRFPRFREILKSDLGLTDAHVDELIDSGRNYRERYRSGEYGYRLFDFRR